MKKLRWQILIAVLALAAIVLLLLGQTQVVETINQIMEPAAGGVYVEGLVGSPIRLNPLLDDYNQVDKDVDKLVFSQLIRFDSWGNPQPDLAESFGVSKTGEIFNVKLRENVLWHDGVPVTTADVLFTIELMRNAEMPISPDLVALWNSVEVMAFDALNMQFRLSEPFAPFMDYLSFGILPRHLLEGKSPQELINDPFNLLPIGSGPYKVADLRVKDGQVQEVVLEANPNYYLGQPYLEQIVFRYFDSTASALQAYQRGEILGIGSVDHASLTDVLAEPGLNVYSVRMPEMTMIFFNLGENGPVFFKDVAVRQALLMALNRSYMIDQALEGQAVISDSPILVGSWAYYDGVEKYTYSPQEAIKLLRAEGYGIPVGGGQIREKDGIPLAFELVFPDTEKYNTLAEMIRDYWAKIGVSATLVPLPADQVIRNYLEPRSYQAVLIDLTLTDSPDPDPYPFWHQAMISSGQNYSQWDDRRASEYLEKARITPIQEERSRLYRNFQIHFSKEVPALPLFSSVYNFAIDDQVLGVQLGPIYDPSNRFNSILNWALESSNVIEGEQTQE